MVLQALWRDGEAMTTQAPSKERVSDIDLQWLIAAYENTRNPATFRREVALALRELLELRTAPEPCPGMPTVARLDSMFAGDDLPPESRNVLSVEVTMEQWQAAKAELIARRHGLTAEQVSNARESLLEAVAERVRAAQPTAPEWQPIETAPKNGNFQVCLDSCPDLSWPAHSNNGELWSKAHGPLNRMVQGRVTTATHWRPAHSPPTKGESQ